MLRPTLFGFLILAPLALVPAAFAVRTQQGPDLARLIQEQAAKVGDRCK